MSDIGPGTLVECIRDDFECREWCHQNGVVFPVKGYVYIIRDITTCVLAGMSFRLVEIRNPPVMNMGTTEPAFTAKAFRPLNRHSGFSEWLRKLPKSEELLDA